MLTLSSVLYIGNYVLVLFAVHTPLLLATRSAHGGGSAGPDPNPNPNPDPSPNPNPNPNPTPNPNPNPNPNQMEVQSRAGSWAGSTRSRRAAPT